MSEQISSSPCVLTYLKDQCVQVYKIWLSSHPSVVSDKTKFFDQYPTSATKGLVIFPKGNNEVGSTRTQEKREAGHFHGQDVQTIEYCKVESDGT